ncbi:NAD(P)H-hydrate dehydratase [Sphingomonas aerophila]|uniref:ADP-dependent (S)-NAD(P)H-hydrate dehydratase n=1 Tax=Sphingomonas aerophila TaxID=1344948 RepID=A0A7W9BCC5_9SPHN|nr:hydroxyethylthiazole kinase-like uncharacterized protein yjeF [Sphingomonas aerophila]
MIEIDADWRAAHPLPGLTGEASKTSRRLLVIGGSRRVPGAIRLTGEAALRVGAGRVRIATLESAAALIGVAFPESGVVGLAEAEGEIAKEAAGIVAEQAAIHHAIVLGPGMGDQEAVAHLVRALADAPNDQAVLVLDAAAVACAGPLEKVLKGWAGRLILTPHHGEMAALAGCEVEDVDRDCENIAREMAARFGAVVALKGVETLVAAPDGTVLHYPGGGRGLGVAGSGDVLAGVIGGLLSRGVDPLAATGWGVWLHGQAGRTLADKVAPLGFLSRELLPELPALLPR